MSWWTNEKSKQFTVWTQEHAIYTTYQQTYTIFV